MKIIKIATFSDLGACKREDINDLISSLVRMGYEVSMSDNYISFMFGNDDEIIDNE